MPDHTVPHPGHFLLKYLTELGITQYRLAKAIRVTPRRINEIVHGRRAITADSALRIGRALGTTPGLWLNLQRHYDLEVARETIDLDSIKPITSPEDARAAA